MTANLLPGAIATVSGGDGLVDGVMRDPLPSQLAVLLAT